MKQKNRHDQGSTFTGLLIGFVIGLALALVLAVYVTKVPVPFLNKTQTRSADQDAAEAKKNKDWDPNGALYGKNPAKGAEVVINPDAAAPPADVKDTQVAPVKAPVKAETNTPAPDALADLIKSKTAEPAAEPFNYFVQVGAYSKVEDAERQKAQLALSGWEAQVSERDQGGSTVHRVRLGPFANRGQAEDLREKLEAKGMTSTLVRVQR
jgi:cell division protein FtsN